MWMIGHLFPGIRPAPRMEEFVRKNEPAFYATSFARVLLDRVTEEAPGNHIGSGDANVLLSQESVMVVRFERVPKEKFKLRPQTRNHSPEYLRRLADSLLQGQLQPVGCLKDFTVNWGNGRVLAGRLEQRITHLDAVILDEEISEREFLRRQAVENFVRNDLSNAEKCKICVHYAKSEPSMSLKQIAADLGVDASMVTRWMAWEKCLQQVQAALETEQITLNTMYSISQLPADQQEAALLNCLSPKKAAAKQNGSRVSRLKCQMPSGAVVTFSSHDGGLSAMAEELAALLKMVKKACEEGLDSKTFERVLRDKAKA
ncbi:MAG TPA: hypothetical protein VH592_13330 [Gemmataceae bacterium]|jgi:hypothetical protein